MKTLLAIWSFLNSRFIATLTAVAILLVSIFLIFRPLLSLLFIFRTNDSDRVEALANLQLLSVSEVVTSDSEPQKFIGKIRNNSRFLIKEVTGAIIFFNSDRSLEDLFTERLDGVSLLRPHAESEFVIIRPPIDRDSAGVESVRTPSDFELKFVDVEVSNEMK